MGEGNKHEHLYSQRRVGVKEQVERSWVWEKAQMFLHGFGKPKTQKYRCVGNAFLRKVRMPHKELLGNKLEGSKSTLTLWTGQMGWRGHPCKDDIFSTDKPCEAHYWPSLRASPSYIIRAESNSDPRRA